MPLRCIDPTMDKSVLAFDLPEDEWRRLEQQNRRDRHLQMPCCSAQVVLRRSRRGTRHFAHKSFGRCTTAPETEAHLRLKIMAVEVARAHGWHAETEVGDEEGGWRADVLARRGKARVAIEIQWSPQTDEEAWRRQERYERAGIRCLWLFRSAGFPMSADLPAARIRGDAEIGFVAALPGTYEEQHVPMRQFLDAAFSRRFRFGLPLGSIAKVRVLAAPVYCWKCGAETTLITFVEIRYGPHEFQFTVDDLEGFPDVLDAILKSTPADLEIGRIKKRFSRTQGRSYLSNGCFHCDAIVGAFFEHEAWGAQDEVSAFDIEVNAAWHRLFDKEERPPDRWGIYQRAPGPQES